MDSWDVVMGALSALAGVAVGPLVAWRYEGKRWLRDRRYDIIRGTLTSARAILWRGDEIDSARVDLTIEEQKNLVRVEMFHLRESLALAGLLLRNDLGHAADELEGCFGNRLMAFFMSISDRADGAHALVAEGRNQIVAFGEAAAIALKKY